ncbi:hypothetical protein GY45DRAFT_650194 [Cubamyces sp. BRFM 1775]|nr:hypothetical protein GY45DRAFT_650194 [Cubamyces sp. BRFM 1775]
MWMFRGVCPAILIYFLAVGRVRRDFARSNLHLTAALRSAGFALYESVATHCIARPFSGVERTHSHISFRKAFPSVPRQKLWIARIPLDTNQIRYHHDSKNHGLLATQIVTVDLLPDSRSRTV